MDKPPRHNDQLGVKKIGKKIKKTPLHLPSLSNGHTSKTRLARSIVPQLTSSLMPTIRPAAALTQSPVSVSLQSSSADSGPSARFTGGGGILPTPVSVCIPSIQSSFADSGHKKPAHDYQQPPPPRFNGSASSVPILSSPRFDGPGILPTPPKVQYPSPLQPRSFTSSSMAQDGILGPGKFPHA